MPLSRKKSCAPCRESKTRCDRTMPECSRCTLRHLTCVYDGKDAYRSAPSLQMPQAQEGSVGFLSTATEPTPVLDQELEMLGSWDSLLGGCDGVRSRESGVSQPGTTSGVDVRAWPEKDTLNIGQLGSRQDPWAFLQEIEDASATVMQRDIPLPNGGGGVNNHALLKKTMFRTCTMCTILLGQVTSYPKMLIEGDALPPFIHAPCRIEDGMALECGERGSHQCLPLELAICAGLVDMFYSRTKANADFVWTSIYQERARLQREYPEFTSMQQLAALQSVTILLLLQASDSSTVETNDSGLLLNTVLNLASTITQTHEWKSEAQDAAINRREWVFRESIRRVICLLYIVEALLDGFAYSSNSVCGSSAGFRTVPLPANRDLWEARTGRKWASSYKQHISSRKMDRALTVGDALDSGGVVSCTSPANPKGAALLPEVMRWAEGLDPFGMLVWMVLPFEEARARLGLS